MPRQASEGTYPPLQMEFFAADQIAFDTAAYDDFLRSHGVPLAHWRAMACPVGKTDPDDARRPDEDHEGCSNGYVYTFGGVVTAGFVSNPKDSRVVDLGRLDGSTVQVVLPRQYDRCEEGCEPKPLRPAQYDRFFLVDRSITVPTWQLFAAHKTGVDRVQFPVVEVVDLMDSSGKAYAPGDYEVAGGRIAWTKGGPGVDPKTGRGVVCSVRYMYRPFWYVKRLMHEVRLAVVGNEMGGRSVERMPQSLELQREYVFEREDRDARIADPANLRQVPGPQSGGFGPR